MHWSKFGRLASLSLTSIGNSVLHLLERALYAHKIESVRIEHPPVFILGHWRSGTTLLHNLLASDPQFTYPNMYQTSFPGHFLLTERLFTRMSGPFMPKERPMDNMPLAWNLPSEDETALLLTTLLSPYLMVAFPNDPSRFERFRNLKKGLTKKEFETWKRAWLYFLKKLTYKTRKPLLLKSPTHTGRIPILLDMFPDAKFIHIVRDPYVVFSSTSHLYEVLCRTSGLNRAMPAQMDETILQGYLDLYQAYHLYRPLIPTENIHELRFEDLEADPIRELYKIYVRFNLPGKENLESRLRSQLKKHRDYRKNEYEIESDLMKKIYERWKPAFIRYGYPRRLPEDANRAATDGDPN